MNSLPTVPLTVVPTEDDRAARATFDVHLDEGWHARALAAEVREGLAARPRRLSPRWLYDDRGSELFDQITRLPEYYPTEAERELLVHHADEIAKLTGADTFVELGSGTSDKTRTLLDAFERAGTLRRFVPFDVSEQTLRHAAHVLNDRHPDLDVHGVVGDFHLHLGEVPNDGVSVLGFLGSTIGNFYPDERARFLAEVAEWMTDDSFFLLGVDLVKPLDRIVDAYNDGAGVTAEFTTNLLAVLNRELGADFDLGAFEHVGLWDPVHKRVDLRLRSLAAQTVSVPGADLSVEFGRDEELHVEISTKFCLSCLGRDLGDAGLDVVETWTDAAGDVAVLLARLGR
ncbi:MAG: L-histidine N(alpha)-methyltransferase [Acidimicrobiales bacterium]